MAATPGPVPPASRRRGRTAALLVAVLALWLVLIEIPEAPVAQLDASWQQVLVHAHEQNRSFGNGLIFSAGPLGFLTSRFYLPDSLTIKLTWEFAGKLIIAFCFVGLTGLLRSRRRAIALIGTIVLAGLFIDAFYVLLLTLAVVHWLLPPAASRGRQAGAMALLIFLAQLKFTFCLLALAGVTLAVAARLGRREVRPALGLAAGFAGGFLGLWLLAGQSPVRLPDYFRYSWSFSSGYPWAMSFDESWPVFFTGAATAILAALCLWQMFRMTPGPRLAALPLVLFLAAVWFISWKHGFTRADGHVLGFFLVSLLLGLALPDLAPAAARWWFAGLFPLGVLGLALADPAMLRDSPRSALDRGRIALHYLVHPGLIRTEFAANFAARRKLYDLPKLRAAIGAGTVDLLNFEQGLLFLNGLNYHPRPIFQSYSAYTDALLQKNAGFFRRPNAPEFLIVRLSTIDGRYPTQDDSLVLAELPLRYDLVLEDGDNVLFRRKAAPPPGEFTRTPVAEHAASLAQEIAAPPHDGHPLWLQASFELSWLGRLRSLFYKPPQLAMVATDSRGEETRHRIIPTIARTGFVVQPLIQTSPDYANFARGRGTKALRSIRFEAASPAEAEFWSRGTVRFARLPELPLEIIDPMRAMMDAGICNLVPDSVTSNTTVQYIALPDQRRALLVHATGSMVFTLPDQRRRLTGDFGFVEGAHTGANRTDGGEFTIEGETAGGPPTVLWQRTLDPLRQPGDRGPQRVDVALPPGLVRVRLHTRPGSKGDGSWDWTYWGNLSFTP